MYDIEYHVKDFKLIGKREMIFDKRSSQTWQMF